MKKRARPRGRSVKLYASPANASADADPNSSHAKVCELVAPGARVLDVGCGAGELAALLTARGGRVWGADLNPAALERANAHCVETRVADLEAVEIDEIFPGLRFDVVVFADVLEHVKEPWRLLQSAREVLDEGGCVVASIPNFAHAAVRLAVLSGTMPYRTLGILDDTHLRFFTRNGVEALFEESGFRLQLIERTVAPFGAHSDLVPDVRLLRVPGEIERHVRDYPESDTLQFVVRAIPLPGVWDMSTLRSRLHDVEARAEEQSVGIHNLERELAELAERVRASAEAERAALASAGDADALREQLAAATAERDALAVSLSDVRAELQSTARALDDTARRAHEAETARDDALARSDDVHEQAARQVEAVAMTAEAARAHVLELLGETQRLRDALFAVECERDDAAARASAAEAAVRETQARLDEASAEGARAREAHAAASIAHAAAVNAQRATAAELEQRTRERDAAAAEVAALRELNGALALRAERAETQRAAGAAQLARIAQTLGASDGSALDFAVAALQRRLMQADAELRATQAELLALREQVRRDELVRLALEHELAGADGDGDEFWRARAVRS